MICPKCSSADYIDNEPCSQCGYQQPATAQSTQTREAIPSRRKAVKPSDNLLFEFARESADRPSSSDWRRELKKKLVEVQEKKCRPDKARALAGHQSSLPAIPPSQSRVPEIKRTVVDPQPIARSSYDIHKNLRDFQASIQSVGSQRRSSPAEMSQTLPMRRELPKASLPRLPAQSAPKPLKVEPEPQNWIVSKGILLTRTLSGLIDLLIVAACSASFLGVSMRFGNIDVMSSSFRPAVWGSILFFQIFYSLYFLILTRRTIGMMLTGLKVVHEQAEEVQLQQLMLRTAFFFVSWALFMLGLFWGVLDRRSRCMHDALSGTIVVRC